VCQAVPDPLDGCTAGYVNYEFAERAHAVVGLRGGFELDSHWSAALNIENLFDRRYYQTIGTPDGGSWYGEPRSFMLTLRGRF